MECKHGQMTLADHAEAWWIEQGNEVPKKDTKGWENMYLKWVDFAFRDLKVKEKSSRGDSK